MLSVLFLFLDLSGTNPNIPPPRRSQFGFKGNHGRNQACREQLEMLEARRLAVDSSVCVCVCFPYSSFERLPLSLLQHAEVLPVVFTKKRLLQRCGAPMASPCVPRSSCKRRLDFSFLNFPGFVASLALPQFPPVLLPALELGPRGISARGLTGDHVTFSKALPSAWLSLLESPG